MKLAGINWNILKIGSNRLECTYSSPCQYYPVQSCQVQPIPAYYSLFQSIPAYSSLFQLIPATSRLFLAYFSLFQYIPTYSGLCQPISQHPISNPQSRIPNLQLEMPDCTFSPQLGIMSVSSLKEFEEFGHTLYLTFVKY